MTDSVYFGTLAAFCTVGSFIGMIKGFFEHNECKRLFSSQEHTWFDGVEIVIRYTCIGGGLGFFILAFLSQGLIKNLPVLNELLWLRRDFEMSYIASVLWFVFSFTSGAVAFRFLCPPYHTSWPKYEVWLWGVAQRRPRLYWLCRIICTFSRPYYTLMSVIAFLYCGFAFWSAPMLFIGSIHGLFGAGFVFKAVIFSIKLGIYMVCGLVGWVLGLIIVATIHKRFEVWLYWFYHDHWLSGRVLWILLTALEYLFLGICVILGMLVVKWFIWPSIITSLIVHGISGLGDEPSVISAIEEVRRLLEWWDLYWTSKPEFWAGIQELVSDMIRKIKQYFASRPPRRPGW